MNKTIGIYSFPKSGNTWVRYIIAGAFAANPDTVPGLHGNPIGNAKYFEENLTDTPQGSRKVRFYKYHGLNFIREQDGIEFNTNNVIHIRRNPLDVFLSYMNFISENVRKKAPIPFSSVDEIKGSEILDQYLSAFIVLGHVHTFPVSGSYFQHNFTWKDRAEKNPNVKLIRYEDLMEDSYSTLSFLNDWVGLKRFDLNQGIKSAKSTTQLNGRFFWKQKLKNFRDYLSEEQIARFVKYRGDDCRKLGYDPKFFLE
ncbi:Sulfotransferase domain protein [Ruegeria denitrificans]|uniref:Sulfotransferase domain protein n=1 Tax=Ruegeria denitrificans TaxID=1715692 RepID=A0A0P1IGZ1_9RHOB|nr:sulfotransferase domain-containing protein [Ruegeria denitrificans]CUJ91811.1 Sulfotransferase domain protein [Ruegeria denitrificans]